MTTTELIKLLQEHEFGASGRSREISIRESELDGGRIAMSSMDSLSFFSSGYGISGAELRLIIE